MAENMKKREARIQKAGGVIGGVIGIASIVFAMAVVVFSGVSVKLTGTGAGAFRRDRGQGVYPIHGDHRRGMARCF